MNLTCAGGDVNGLLVRSREVSDDIRRKAGGITATLLQEKSSEERFFNLLNSAPKN